MNHQNDQFDSLRRRYSYPTKSPRIAFRDDGTSTLRHLVRDVIKDYRTDKIPVSSLRVIPLVCTHRAHVSSENPLLAELDAELLVSEPKGIISIPVSGGVRLLPTMGTLAVQVRETYGMDDTNARFATMSTRRLVTGYYRYSQQHHIASPMMLLDELVMTPMAAIGTDHLVMS